MGVCHRISSPGVTGGGGGGGGVGNHDSDKSPPCPTYARMVSEHSVSIIEFDLGMHDRASCQELQHSIIIRTIFEHNPPRPNHVQDSAIEPDDHYPLTCTPENGVWMLWETCRFLPLPGSEAKSLNLMTFYEGKKSMSMISWSRKGTQAN